MRLMLCALYTSQSFSLGWVFFNSAINFDTCYKSALNPQAVVIEALKSEGIFLPVLLVG